jgi:hypothetical protein
MGRSEAVLKQRQRRWQKGDQIPTRATTVEDIMSRATFALGVADARAGRSMHKDYDTWGTNGQWDYERGRCWARLAPRNLEFKRNGKITREAIHYFSQDIL